MWDGKVPEIKELREKAARIGPGKPGWRVYWYEDVFWVARVDLFGREEVIAGVSPDRQVVWLRDLHLNWGEVILEAAGVA